MAEAPLLSAGCLLVATPMLLDPNFDHTVIALLDLNDEGALGVVLNRPSTMPVGEVLPAWSEVSSPPSVVFAGGPVSTDSALAVAVLDGEDDDDPVGFRRLFRGTGIIDLDAPPDVLAPAVTGVRVFAGYAGWGAGQLESEIAAGGWYVVPSEREDLFGATPERLWTRVLRRQPGELAWVSTRPADPTWN